MPKPATPCFDRAWRARCRLGPIERKLADWMIRRHYLGKWPGITVLTLGLLDTSIESGGLIGVIVFALPPRETSKRYGGTTWELARLWVSDAIPANAETFIIGAALRYIRRAYPQVQYIVSYADPSVNHQGTIYRAANFRADGRTDDERKSPRFDYVDAVSGKHYSRRGHVPEGTKLIRKPRVSKYRYVRAL